MSSISPEGQKYLTIIKELLEKIEREQAENIDRASELMANAIADDRLIHYFAAGGHTWMTVMEAFWRAGGLACVNPWFDLGITLYNQAWHGCLLERLTGYGKAIVEYYSSFVKPGDVLVITTNIPYMTIPVEVAMECKKIGMKVISIGSKEWQEKAPMDTPSRHPSGKSLVELSDIFIDDYNPYGDAVIKLEGLEQPIAPVSSITDCYIIERLLIETVKKLLKRGIEPPVFRSANIPGGDEFNRKLIARYINRVKWL